MRLTIESFETQLSLSCEMPPVSVDGAGVRVVGNASYGVLHTTNCQTLLTVCIEGPPYELSFEFYCSRALDKMKQMFFLLFF